ncbi:uncharacterized protein CBL_00920 [Carabus blaptoides fortunei]
MPRILEVCVDSYVSAMAAIEGGAHRLELCSSLSDGGLTPTPGLLKQIQSVNSGKVQIFCMLRCRSSNFVYTHEELTVMMNDAQILKQNGADGFVFGALLENGDVDLKKCREIVKLCYPLPVTFHRAFDICRNPVIQLESIIDLGFSRILTSGQKKSAEEGIELIKQLKKRAGNRIIIMPGAGVTKDNLKLLIDEIDAAEYHGSFKMCKTDEEDAKQANAVTDFIDLGSLTITDGKLVAEIVHILKLE